jgi:hypothetical protein
MKWFNDNNYMIDKGINCHMLLIFWKLSKNYLSSLIPLSDLKVVKTEFKLFKPFIFLRK